MTVDAIGWVDEQIRKLREEREQARRIAAELEQELAEVRRLLHHAEQHGLIGVQAARDVRAALDVLRGERP